VECNSCSAAAAGAGGTGLSKSIQAHKKLNCAYSCMKQQRSPHSDQRFESPGRELQLVSPGAITDAAVICVGHALISAKQGQPSGTSNHCTANVGPGVGKPHLVQPTQMSLCVLLC